jgi:cell cycle sensor histidine kinase DivJ
MNIEQRGASPSRKSVRQPSNYSKPLRTTDVLTTRSRASENPLWTTSTVGIDVTRNVGLALYEILAIADLMREAYGKQDLETFQTQLSLLSSETTRFAAALSSLIELAKFEAEPGNIVYEHFDVVALLREVSHAARSVIGNKPITMMDVFSPCPVFITSDRARIRQIMMELISNAAKFTFRGRVAVILNNDDDRIRLTVTDTGIGMTTEQINALFGPPKQPHEKESAMAPAGGRGIRIIRNLVSQLNAGISVSSKLGEGTIVEVSLPVEPTARLSELQRMIQQEHPMDFS